DSVEYSRDGEQWHDSLSDAMAPSASRAAGELAATLQVRAVDLAGNVTTTPVQNSTGPYAIESGVRVVFAASGFDPSSLVRVELRPDRVTLSELTADDSGVV